MQTSAMTLSPTELAERAKISVPYASQLLSGDPAQRREPSLGMALRIYEATGLQFGILKGLTTKQIEPLRKAAA